MPLHRHETALTDAVVLQRYIFMKLTYTEVGYMVPLWHSHHEPLCLYDQAHPHVVQQFGKY